MKKFESYIEKVKEQLYCNASEEYKNTYTTYLYSNQQIENNLEYFEKSMKMGLSPYKALLFFQDHLEDDVEKFKAEINGQLSKSTRTTDLSDLGNEIGIIVGKYLSDDKMGFKKEDFISGIKHGISLIDGTHEKQ